MGNENSRSDFPREYGFLKGARRFAAMVGVAVFFTWISSYPVGRASPLVQTEGSEQGESSEHELAPICSGCGLQVDGAFCGLTGILGWEVDMVLGSCPAPSGGECQAGKCGGDYCTSIKKCTPNFDITIEIPSSGEHELPIEATFGWTNSSGQGGRVVKTLSYDKPGSYSANETITLDCGATRKVYTNLPNQTVFMTKVCISVTCTPCEFISSDSSGGGGGSDE